MTPDRRALLDEVAGCLPPLERPVLVAVDGADGSGKTWFADELAEVLREAADRPVVRASVDDFHHPREHRYAAGRTGETVWERSFDYLALRRRLIDPWRRGPGTSYVARWHDLRRDARVEQPPGEVPDSAVLVVDGVFLQRPELYDAWDLTVWLDVPDEERVRRMAARDGVPDDPSHPDQQRYLDAQRIYRETCDPVGLADLVVDNADPERPVLRGPTSPGCPTCGRPWDPDRQG